MSGLAYACIGGSLVVLGGVLVMIAAFNAEAWIGRDLKRGDLSALAEVASGLRTNELRREQAHRLEARGLVRRLAHGHFRATLKGRVALGIRRLVRRQPPAAKN